VTLGTTGGPRNGLFALDPAARPTLRAPNPAVDEALARFVLLGKKESHALGVLTVLTGVG